MKKQIMTIALVLVLGMTAFAQQAGGGLFNRGEIGQSGYDRNSPYWSTLYLPEHGGIFNDDTDFGLDPAEDPNDPPAPLGGGALLLVGFGAAYAMTKRKKEN